MANGDTPPVSLMDRQGMDLDLDDVQAVEVEALPGDIATRVEIEGVEIVEEDDGGAPRESGGGRDPAPEQRRHRKRLLPVDCRVAAPRAGGSAAARNASLLATALA